MENRKFCAITFEEMSELLGLDAVVFGAEVDFKTNQILIYFKDNQPPETAQGWEAFMVRPNRLKKGY